MSYGVLVGLGRFQRVLAGLGMSRLVSEGLGGFWWISAGLGGRPAKNLPFWYADRIFKKFLRNIASLKHLSA